MSKGVEYLIRVVLVCTLSVVINMVLDRMLGIPFNSLIDWLMFFALWFAGMYFFVWQWDSKSQVER